MDAGLVSGCAASSVCMAVVVEMISFSSVDHVMVCGWWRENVPAVASINSRAWYIFDSGLMVSVMVVSVGCFLLPTVIVSSCGAAVLSSTMVIVSRANVVLVGS